MEWYHVYLFQQVENFIGAMLTISAISGIGCGSGLFFWLVARDDGESELAKDILRYAKIVFTICWVSTVLYILTPNRKTIAAMYFVPKVYNSEFVQEDLPQDLKDLHGVFREWISDMKQGEKK